MSGFRAVNTSLAQSMAGKAEEEIKTPTTPRQIKSFHDESAAGYRSDDASAKTPTRESFGGLADQKPLPASSLTPGQDEGRSDSRNGATKRDSMHRSTRSVDSVDIDMDDEEGLDGSDDESVNSEANRPSKKKKGQRFFCTDFPPCQLSFTRSEHLARHIRKHTGERPFQCHCSRRFSRLDNLRQHAQTVHVNEDIPGDSLAATGTRFQRQIRTDRVRPPSSRSRASTLGSQGGHSRGHSRNLSASSIASTTSNISQRDDNRRRPPPLAMANDGSARARLTLDTFNPSSTGSPGTQLQGYNASSASGYSTPTSATFSTGTGSPMFTPGLQSPIAAPRPVTWAGGRTPGRRLSVPSGAPLFHNAPGPSHYPNAFGPPLQSPPSSIHSGNSSVLASPTSSVFSESRRDSNVDSDWRRRTWHPGTYQALMQRPATSGLSYHQTPDVGPLQSAQPAANQTRLPGIESFDRFDGNMPQPSIIRRQPSPMQLDAPTQRTEFARPPEPSSTPREDRRAHHVSWDLHKGLTELDIANATPPKEQRSWLQQPPNGAPHQVLRPTTAPHPSFFNHQASTPTPRQPAPEPIQVSNNVAVDPPTTPRKNKRHGWYNGPLQASPPESHPQPQMQSLPQQRQIQHRPTSQGHSQPRTSPEDSSSSEGVPTPSTSSLNEFHPAIMHSNGFIEAHPPNVAGAEQTHKSGPQQRLASGRHGAPVGLHGSTVDSRASAYGFQNGVGPSEHRAPPAPYADGQANDMRRLEALVAVATGENMGVTARP